MTTTLLISTYNWEAALSLCLESVLTQTIMPDEVIVADDGSTEKTAELINAFRKRFPCPLIHVWQEDIGFQAAKIRNKAIAASSCDYIIQIDGDIIIHPKFVQDHISAAKKGYFCAGSRVKITPKQTKRLLAGESKRKLSLKGYSHILNRLRIPFLAGLFYNLRQKDILYGRGCNFAFWKADAYKINGYDEDYIGYGEEDTDLIYRLILSGVKKRFVKFKAIQFHIYHTQRISVEVNELRFDHKTQVQTVWCKNGLDKYTTPDFIKSR